MTSGIPVSHVRGIPVQAERETVVRYVGLATRAIAFVLDAALINLVAVIVEVGAALILSLLHPPNGLKAVVIALGAAAYAVWTISYRRVLVDRRTDAGKPRHADPSGEVQRRPLKPPAAIVRCIGLAALPLFAGYVWILFDARRRGFHDRLARTLVVEAPQLSIAEMRRAKRRAASPHLEVNAADGG